MHALLKTADFRANPNYKIRPYNRQQVVEERDLPDGQVDPDGYGLLLPSECSDLPIIAVCRETALLFLTLQEPGPLPDYVESVFGVEGERGLERLMLDRILEVAGPHGYVSGPEACVLLGLDTPLGVGRIARLSQAALQFGQELELSNPSALSLKLYLYNQRPASPGWRRRVPDRNGAAEFLGIAPGGPSEPSLTRAWQPLEGSNSWLFFTARAPKPMAAGSLCKLYVSPVPESLPEAMGAVIEGLARSGAHHFKVGADLYGLLRPDKLVAYFASKEALLAAIEALGSRLEGMPVQGVPFSAEAGCGGLLSWGADPLGGSESEGRSWRQWVTNRLATALIGARDAPAGAPEPWRFALERIRLEGVDPQTFSPTAGWAGARTG